MAAHKTTKAEGRAPGTPAAGDVGRSDRVRGTFQPKSDVLPGKGPGKGPDAKSAPPLTLAPSGEIAPAAPK